MVTLDTFLSSNNKITSNPLHSVDTTPIVSSMLALNEDTITNLIMNDHISGETGIK